jgi:hypothetical protein
MTDSGKAMYHVVDGKQRLETIIMFVEDKISLDKEFGDDRLNGKKWSEIDKEAKQSFWDYTIGVEYLSSIEGVTLNEVFDRFNRNARKLEPQELRHARFDGWFISVSESEAEREEYTKVFKLLSPRQSKRMKDVQFISELLCVIIDNKIVGFDQFYLDEKYGQYDDPLKNQIEFSVEEFEDRLHDIRQYISNIENENQCVSKHAKTNTHFYTLWALVALNFDTLPSAMEFAKKYLEFMEKVDGLKVLASQGIRSSSDTNQSLEEIYYRNSIGAMTEPPQRNKRYEALKQAIL